MTDIYKHGRKIHHVTDMDEKCVICDKPFKKYWFDADEQNGVSDTMWGFDGNHKHKECVERETGKPPLGLNDLNEIEKRGITREQYYKEHGYD